VGQAQSHGDSPLCPRIAGTAGRRERHHAPPDTPLLHAPAAPCAPVRTRRPIRHLRRQFARTHEKPASAGSGWRLCRRTGESRSSSSARVRPAVERTNSCMARACDVPARTCPRAALTAGSRGTTEAARSRARRHGTNAQAQHSSAGASALRRTPCATRAAPWPAQIQQNRGKGCPRGAKFFFSGAKILETPPFLSHNLPLPRVH
jgi:hypothetical protein